MISGDEMLRQAETVRRVTRGSYIFFPVQPSNSKALDPMITPSVYSTFPETADLRV